MSTLKPADKELLRKALLRFLAERFRLSFSADQCARMMTARGYVDFEIESSSIEESSVVLQGKKLIEITPDDFGSTPYYKITGAGVIENERVNG